MEAAAVVVEAADPMEEEVVVVEAVEVAAAAVEAADPLEEVGIFATAPTDTKYSRK